MAEEKPEKQAVPDAKAGRSEPGVIWDSPSMGRIPACLRAASIPSARRGAPPRPGAPPAAGHGRCRGVRLPRRARSGAVIAQGFSSSLSRKGTVAHTVAAEGRAAGRRESEGAGPAVAAAGGRRAWSDMQPAKGRCARPGEAWARVSAARPGLRFRRDETNRGERRQDRRRRLAHHQQEGGRAAPQVTPGAAPLPVRAALAAVARLAVAPRGGRSKARDRNAGAVGLATTH